MSGCLVDGRMRRCREIPTPTFIYGRNFRPVLGQFWDYISWNMPQRFVFEATNRSKHVWILTNQLRLLLLLESNGERTWVLLQSLMTLCFAEENLKAHQKVVQTCPKRSGKRNKNLYILLAFLDSVSSRFLDLALCMFTFCVSEISTGEASRAESIFSPLKDGVMDSTRTIFVGDSI